MWKAIVSFFGVATLIATIVTLIGYLLSRGTSFGSFFDKNWDLILAATGLTILGLILVGTGGFLLFSVEGAFNVFTVPVSLATMAGGGFLVYLGVAVIIGIGSGSDSAAALAATLMPATLVGYVDMSLSVK
jgi:hypothetical protein